MVVCKICNKEFESAKEVSKHLVEEHNFTTEQLYNYYNYSFETGKAICPICGKEFIMTKRQIDGFKKNPNKSIGCCTSCSKAVIIVTHGSPLANPETYKKTKESLKQHYGVGSPAQSKEVRDRMKATMKEKYGVENASQSKELQEKKKKTNLERYGTEHAIGSKIVRNRAKKTLLNKYGVNNAFKSEEIKNKIKETNLKNLGVEHPAQSREVVEKMKQTNLEKYGVELPLQSLEIQEKMKQTNLKRYGAEHLFQVPEIIADIKEKSKETMLERYGVEYFCQHEKCIKAAKRRVSKVNKKFHEFLNENNVYNELEFIVENLGYDLRADNILIEIDPWVTHNVTIGPSFGGKEIEPRPIEYHINKTMKAREHGYNCIHIFDWDDWNKILYLLKDKKEVYARKCEVKEIDKKAAKEFLESYHLQGSTRQAEYNYGLYYKGELVEVMTFGKPRYNKNYEYELLRLCTKPTVKVVGGASKLLKHFEKQVKPKSIISYCDLSKFNGEVYKKLGFEQIDKTLSNRHWYNPKTKRHITDNLLRQRGFDQLHNANFGKGTSNEELMREHGYVEIYDCGQLVFIKQHISN